MPKEQLKTHLNKLSNSSSLNDIQVYITEMMKINNFNNTPLELFCYLTEELGELAKEIRKQEKNMDMDLNKTYNSCLEHELADCFIYLLALCNSYNIDLFKAFQNKEKINLERNWE